MSSMLCAAGRLRPMLVVPLLAVVLLVAGCGWGGTKTTTTTVTRTVTTQASPGQNALGPSSTQSYYGMPVSISSIGAKGYLLVLKPEFFLTGVTAEAAYAASVGKPCTPPKCGIVPNNYWVAPAGSTDLQFILPKTTTGTVLTYNKQGNDAPTKVTVEQLASVFAGGKSPKLAEPLSGGIWVSMGATPSSTSFMQQYRP